MSDSSDPDKESGPGRRTGADDTPLGSAEHPGDKRLPDDAPTGSAESPGDKRLSPAAAVTAHVATESLVRQHEVQEVDVRAIVRFGLGLLAAAIIIQLALWWYLAAQTRQSLALEMQLPPAAVTPASEIGPGIEEAPAAERAARLSPALARIHGYGWVDQKAGTVHIPVEQAIELLAEQGLPATQNEAPTFGLDPAYRADSSGGRTLTAESQ